jgi:hypothetical protein
MARDLKNGDRVVVKKTFRVKKGTPAHKQGLKTVKEGDTGEVVGPAEGRAVTVSFNGIEVPITKQSLTRAEEAEQTAAAPEEATKPAKTSRKQQETPAEPAQAAAEMPAQEETAPKRRGRKPGSGRKAVVVAQAADASGANDAESGQQLVTLIANKLLLKGSVRAEPGTSIEVMLSDLPEPVRSQIQRLVDAKLSLDLKSLRNR